MAWNRSQGDRCNRCRTYTWEWEEGDNYDVGTERCRGCEMLEAQEKAMGRTKSNDLGMKIGLYPRGMSDD